MPTAALPASTSDVFLQVRAPRRVAFAARILLAIALVAGLVVATGCSEPSTSGEDTRSSADDDAEGQDDGTGADTSGKTEPRPKDAGPMADARVVVSTSSGRPDAGHNTNDASANPADAAAPRVDAGGSAGAVGDAGPFAEAPDGGDSADPADECAGGTSLPASDDPSSKTKASAQSDTVEFMLTESKNTLKRLRTKLVVPPVPKGSSTLFIWPGVQPGYGNDGTIGNGILQPVLTWGVSCLRNDNKPTWWISGEYVNVSTFDPKYANCHGGEGMEVDVGDELEMIIEANGTVWRQTVTDMQKSKTVTYDIDLGGQRQGWFIWSIELASSTKPAGDVVFTDTTITFEKPDEKACQPISRGAASYFSGPRISPSKTTCCLSKITLRAPGVAATTKP